MEKGTKGNTLDDDGKPNSITVTGEEWWIRNHGLTEELPWPHDEVDDSNLSQVYEDTPPSSLDVSVTGEVEYNHGGVTAGEMSDRLQRDDCLLEMGVQDRRCMTNMVMWNTDVQNGMDGQIRGRQARS